MDSYPEARTATWAGPDRIDLMGGWGVIVAGALLGILLAGGVYLLLQPPDLSYGAAYGYLWLSNSHAECARR